MRQNRRSNSINLLASIAVFLLLGGAVANAQRPVADDGDLSKAQVEQKGSEVLPSATSAPAGLVAVRPWTSAASTGQHDEDSAALVRYNSFGASLGTGQTGAVHIRYNITAVEGVGSLCPATSSTIRTRFRNSDNAGSTARVTYEIRTSSIASGGNTVIYTFDSNGKGGGTAFKTTTDTPAIDFNFATNMYWIEATIFRSVATEFADLGTIQIWESAGSPCM